jgi:nucleoid-associated protein YgaU
MLHLERAAVASVVTLVGILLGLSLYWTGEVTRTLREPGASQTGAVALGAPTWDLSRPLPEPAPLGPEGVPPSSTIPIATPRLLEAGSEGQTSETPAGGDSERTYVVRDGDRLETIALREMGSRKGVAELLRANPGLEPERLRVGKSIRIPAREAGALAGAPAAAPAPAAPPKPAVRTFTVRKGDTLWSIAVRALGDGQRWREIVARNPSLLGDGRPPHEGMVLALP